MRNEGGRGEGEHEHEIYSEFIVINLEQISENFQ